MGFKKSLASILTTGLITGLLIGCSNQQNFSQKINSSQKQKKVERIYAIKMPKSILQAQKYLHEKIKYVSEKEDKWNSAEKTLRLGHGDCEDIAILGGYFAENLDYPPKMLLLIESMRYCHVITLLEDKTSQGIKYGAIEKNDLFYPVYNSVNDLILNINRACNKNYSIYSICDLNKFKTDWRTSDENLRNYHWEDFHDLKLVEDKAK